MSTTYIASKHMPRVRFADHAERLTCKQTFAEEPTITQYADRGFLPVLETTVSLTLPVCR